MRDDTVFTTYEVYLFSASRDDWVVAGRYASDEREDAVNQARVAYDQGDTLAIRVLRQSYYPARNRDVEIVVLSRAKNARRRIPPLETEASREKRAAQERAATEPALSAAARGEPELHARSGRDGARADRQGSQAAATWVGKLLLAVAGSLGIAGLVAFAMAIALREARGLGLAISEAGLANLVFLTFVLLFLMSLITALLRLIPQMPTGGPQPGRTGNRPPATPGRGRARGTSADSTHAEWAAETADNEAAAEPPAPAPEEPRSPAEAAADQTAQPEKESGRRQQQQADDGTGDKQEKAAEKDKAETAQQQDQQQAGEAGDGAAQQEEATEAPAQADEAVVSADPETRAAQSETMPTPASDEYEPARMTLMRFLGDMISRLKQEHPKLDAYTRFGLNLFLAGAAEKLGETKELPEEDIGILVRESAELFGARPDLARSFCAHYPEYLLEPRYLGMVSRGRTTMEEYLDGSADAYETVPEVLDEWVRPSTSRTQQAGIVTILLTDIVGSTDITQDRGDAGAQALIRRHNALVREALQRHYGTEVKHTGDGIMASFPGAARAVDAAVAIQQAAVRHNDSTPDVPLRLRVGLNAGEPIQEENDLFGTVVQLASRICNDAPPETILASNVVRELATGRQAWFADKGEVTLKGFQEPVHLYEVLWRGDAENTGTGTAARTATPAAGESA